MKDNLEFYAQKYLNEFNIPIKYGRLNNSVLKLFTTNNLEEAGWPRNSAYKFKRIYLPHKTDRSSYKNFMLKHYNKAQCNTCSKIKDLTSFKKEKDYCCHNCKLNKDKNYYAINKDSKNHTNSFRRALIINRLPSWSNTKKITEIYNNCPEGYHVDHIVPLQGELVSGLHVPENLQYLPASENLSKGNRYTIE